LFFDVWKAFEVFSSRSEIIIMPLESSHKVQRKKNNCKFLKTEYEHSENIISALESIERISYRFTLRNRSLPCCSPEKEDRTEGGVRWGFEGGGGGAKARSTNEKNRGSRV